MRQFRLEQFWWGSERWSCLAGEECTNSEGEGYFGVDGLGQSAVSHVEFSEIELAIPHEYTLILQIMEAMTILIIKEIEIQ